MATDTADLIRRFSDIYLHRSLSDDEIDAYAARVDGQAITLAAALMSFHVSQSRSTSMADELTSLFFVTMDRPPDYVTFSIGQRLLRDGASLNDIASVALGLPYSELNYLQSNQVFVDRLAHQLFYNPELIPGLSALRVTLVSQLNSGMLTRPELLATAVQLEHPNLKYRNFIDTSLIAMASTGGEATRADLDLFASKPTLHIIREMLEDAGELPYGSLPHFQLDPSVSEGGALKVSGSPIGTLDFNFLERTSSLTETVSITNYRLVYSADRGLSESVTRFKPALLGDFDIIDLRDLVTDSLVNVSVITHNRGSTVLGAEVPNSLRGGSGQDTLIGGGASDVLHASSGRDTLSGMGGDDTFVLAPSAIYRGNLSTHTIITDFGLGADTLSLQSLFGVSGDTSEAELVKVNASPTTGELLDLSGLESRDIVLAVNTGEWLSSSGALRRAAAADIHLLFSEVTLNVSKARPEEYLVLSYDTLNGADIWLVSNFTDLSVVSINEIYLIGRLLESGNGNLLTAIESDGAFLS